MTKPEFETQYLSHLNPQQRQAVQQIDGPALLLAVPGSGKTTVLVTRLGYMLYCCGIMPQETLTVTYTVAAAQDMKARFSSLFGVEENLQFRTLNGICDTIIRYYVRTKGRTAFDLVTNDRKLSEILRGLLGKQSGEYRTDQQMKELKTMITYCKNRMLTETEIDEQKVDGVDFAVLWRDYHSYMIEHRLMDFDDQMVIALKILHHHADILEDFRRRYRYISVDEAQDTSKIQHEIIGLLAKNHRNLFMVGDEDQSIYGFRAAWPEALLTFDQRWTDGKVLLMEENYRSTKSIVERADRFIARNIHRHQKHMVTKNPKGDKISLISLKDYQGQYCYLADVARKNKVQTAVLYRNNDSALPLIDLLEREHIPYACRQRESFFFTSPVVRDLLDILKFTFEPENGRLFLSFYYKLDLKIKRTTLEEILARGETGHVLDILVEDTNLNGWQVERLKSLRTHFEKIKTLTSYSALHRVIKFMGYGTYLEERGGDTFRAEVLLGLAKEHPDIDDFKARLVELKEILGTKEEIDAPFILSTIHASKGMEYDRVILLDVVDGILPSLLTPTDLHLSEEEHKDLEEERRLFYVGVTRARHKLELITAPSRFGGLIPSSTFIRQLMEDARPKNRILQKITRSDVEVNLLQQSFVNGSAVTHQIFGRGIVVNRIGAIILIQFEDGMSRKLDLPSCIQKGLLSRI